MPQDFELAAWQLTYLCLAPKRVYVDLYCSRNDPWIDSSVDTGMSTSTSVGGHRDLNATKLTNSTETKNTWARDDPAILILLSACLCGECSLNTQRLLALTVRSVAALAWSVVYSYSLIDCFKLALLMILRDFLLVGIVMATIFWLVPRSGWALRLVEHVQGVLEQRPARPSITLDCGGFQSRVGIRV